MQIARLRPVDGHRAKNRDGDDWDGDKNKQS